MAGEIVTHVDINSAAHDFARLVEDVRNTNTPRVITRDGEELVVVMPLSQMPKATRRGRTRKGLTMDDSLWNIVGIAASNGPGDVAENHDRYLADAYADTHE
jgi:hypothetical protein